MSNKTIVRRPDYNYRPNSGRAIYLTEVFSEALAARLLPQIHALRITEEPLTAFINSRGGSITVLDTVYAALTSKDADDAVARLITVALGEASSAAATLLVMGNYATAYPETIIHFHGARYSDIDVMTVESASNYNRLTAADAYWLGCIDEVMGLEGFRGERADVEMEDIPLPSRTET